MLYAFFLPVFVAVRIPFRRAIFPSLSCPREGKVMVRAGSFLSDASSVCRSGREFLCCGVFN